MSDSRPSTDPVRVAATIADLTSYASSDACGTVADLGQRLVDLAVDLVQARAAGMLLVSEPDGADAELLASTDHTTALLEIVQVRSGEGPCLAAVRARRVVVVDDVEDVVDRWPAWYQGARALGVRAAYGIPMQVRGSVVGALNVFLDAAPALAPGDVAVLSSLGEAAAGALVQHRAVADAETLAGQLQRALDSRVVIEQAKGLVAERHGIEVGEAFALLRDAARASSRGISEVARAVVEGREQVGEQVGEQGPGRPRAGTA
ncbi:GAF and ANTAR domain-containing protein [Actinotalea sp. Marseille-Q4924]|uniref:GAF and ANTAR domain-containing protein n=1 Tax=Actinotalea sp. Marseille-Q4924 TaxID=2866571 RepID=UPI001CE4AC74|nr:GAF and ANTAR domain-containing protein [Actinotalea sp. Marseille-Q4924]